MHSSAVAAGAHGFASGSGSVQRMAANAATSACRGASDEKRAHSAVPVEAKDDIDGEAQREQAHKLEVRRTRQASSHGVNQEAREAGELHGPRELREARG
eukprot:432621-Prymnesium_polylepis.2